MQLGKIAVEIVRAIYADPDNVLMEILEKDSLFGDTVVQDFCNMAEDYKVLSFYETRALPGMKIVSHRHSLPAAYQKALTDRSHLDCWPRIREPRIW